MLHSPNIFIRPSPQIFGSSASAAPRGSGDVAHYAIDSAESLERRLDEDGPHALILNLPEDGSRFVSR